MLPVSLEEECNCFDGDLTIRVINGKKFGNLRIDGSSYVIRDLSDNLNIMAKNKPSTTGAFCGVQEEGSSTNTAAAVTTSSCPIRVLAIFTDAAEEVVPDIEQTVHTGFDLLKTSLLNSDVSEYQLKVELAGIVKVDFVESSFPAPNIETDLLNLSQNNAFISEVGGTRNIPQLRTDFEADVIMLFGQADWGQKIGFSFNGINAANPFSIVKAFMVDGNAPLLVAHEFGHLMGGRHETCDAENNSQPDCDDNGDFEHAHIVKFCAGTRKRTTVMYANLGDNQTFTENRRMIPNYSNPSVLFKNKPTGIVDERDNARLLRQNACTVADYFTSTTPAMTVGIAPITGNAYSCPCSGKGLIANNYGSGTNLSYQWEVSSDGINWTSISGGHTTSVDVPCNEGEILFVRVTVTASNGQTATATYWVEAANPVPGATFPCQARIGNTGLNPNLEDLLIQPNPATNEAQLIFQLKEVASVSLKVTDIQGYTVYQYSDKQAVAGKHEVTFPAQLFANGLYLCELNVNHESTVQKIIISH